MKKRRTLRKSLLIAVTTIVVVASATALAQTASQAVNITEIAIATELAEGVPAAEVTELERGSGETGSMGGREKQLSRNRRDFESSGKHLHVS